MTARSIRRAQERKAKKLARRAATTATNSSVSDVQLIANRQNAQLSTGPKSDEGKATSSLNAVKTGLTGRTVLLPTDDAAEYQCHVAAYTKEFQPVGQRECDLVQSIADTQWRLLRIPSLEAGIYALGHLEFGAALEEHDAALRPGMIEVRTFLAYERQLRNLHLQESRLQRRREKEIAELREIQKLRKADEEKIVERAFSPVDSHPARPTVNGFVFSTDSLVDPLSPGESHSGPDIHSAALAA